MKRILFVAGTLIAVQLTFGQVTSSGSTNYIPFFINANQIDNSALYQLNSNVGIGTTGPNYPLQIRRAGGGGSIGFTIDNYLGASTRDAGFWIVPDNSNDVGGYQFRTHNGVSGDINALSISGNGNVGIGTTSPGTKLSVYNPIVDFNGDGKPSTVLNLGAYNNGIGEGPSIDFNLRWNGGYEATSQTTGWLAGRVAGIYDPQVGNGGALAFYTNSGTSAAGGANSAEVSEKLRISPSGNVGIGTASPDYALTIKKNGAAATNGLWLRTYDDYNDYGLKFYNPVGIVSSAIQSYKVSNSAVAGLLLNPDGGNVGIGTTNPADGKLNIYGAGNHIKLTGSGQSNAGIWANADLMGFGAWESVSNRLSINLTTGNVGIGITNPTQARLVINSGVSNQNAYIDGNRFSLSRTSDAAEIVYLKKTTDLGSSGTANLHGYDGIQFRTSGSETVRMTITQSGSVGIGTPGSSALLHVKHPSGNLTTRFEGASNTYDSKMYISSASSGDGGFQYLGSNKMDIFSYGDLAFDVGTGNISGAIANERMRITQAGTVGIGTAIPIGGLDVNNGDIVINDGYADNANGGYDSRKLVFDAQESSQGGGIDRKAQIFFDQTDYQTPARLTFQMDGVTKMVLDDVGNVGIGTTATGTCRLAVEGKIGAREVIVQASGWPDYVFDESYLLPSLDEVENSIKTAKHLPGIPSKEEVAESGVKLGEMQTKLLQKIEELTLYVIEQNKELTSLKNENKELKQKMTAVEQQLQTGSEQ